MRRHVFRQRGRILRGRGPSLRLPAANAQRFPIRNGCRPERNRRRRIYGKGQSGPSRAERRDEAGLHTHLLGRVRIRLPDGRTAGSHRKQPSTLQKLQTLLRGKGTARHERGDEHGRLREHHAGLRHAGPEFRTDQH